MHGFVLHASISELPAGSHDSEVDEVAFLAGVRTRYRRTVTYLCVGQQG